MADETKGTILVVEDNEIFRNMVADKLRAEGYEPILFESTVTFSEVKEKRPAVVLVDVVSPKDSGLQLVKDIREDAELGSLPVIAIVKAEDSVVAAHARKLGVHHVVDKVVFQAPDLLNKISLCLDPKKGVQETPAESNTAPFPGDQHQSGSEGGKILLVEDDAFMRDLFAQSLRNAGFVVQAVESAEEGLELLKGEVLPELVLLDLLLPGKSGFEFLAEVKRKERFSSIPIVVVSNLGSKGDIDRATDLGAVDFLIKANATIDEIISKAREYIERSRKGPILPKSVVDKE